MTGKIEWLKLRCIKKGMAAFEVGRVYDGYDMEQSINGVKIVAIANLDGDGEVYAFPAEWFEVVEDDTKPS